MTKLNQEQYIINQDYHVLNDKDHFNKNQNLFEYMLKNLVEENFDSDDVYNILLRFPCEINNVDVFVIYV